MFHAMNFKYSPSNTIHHSWIFFYQDTCIICVLTFIFRLILYKIEINMNDDSSHLMYM